jgi:DNA-binding CsgD family transcriptional regulator
MAQSDELSNREKEVIELLLQGKSNKLIASALGISERTVEFHLKNIYAKRQVGSRTELILKLGQSTGANNGKPGQSTVAEQGEVAENRDTRNSKSWVASSREAVFTIGKELRMESLLNSNASHEADTMSFFDAIRACITKYAELQNLMDEPRGPSFGGLHCSSHWLPGRWHISART